MAKLTEPATQQKVAERLGVGLEEVANKAVVDPAVTLTDNLERLRNAPSVPDDLAVSGFVYDVADGSLTEITRTGPLRSHG
jgi:carbonic anhydrase